MHVSLVELDNECNHSKGIMLPVIPTPCITVQGFRVSELEGCTVLGFFGVQFPRFRPLFSFSAFALEGVSEP